VADLPGGAGARLRARNQLPRVAGAAADCRREMRALSFCLLLPLKFFSKR
jgi:hypothetical protein